jgi:hypothetical protein
MTRDITPAAAVSVSRRSALERAPNVGAEVDRSNVLISDSRIRPPRDALAMSTPCATSNMAPLTAFGDHHQGAHAVGDLEQLALQPQVSQRGFSHAIRTTVRRGRRRTVSDRCVGCPAGRAPRWTRPGSERTRWAGRAEGAVRAKVTGRLPPRALAQMRQAGWSGLSATAIARMCDAASPWS